MKKTITTIALSLLSISLSAQVPSTGLVGYWPFTGNANNLSKATVTGATLQLLWASLFERHKRQILKHNNLD